MYRSLEGLLTRLETALGGGAAGAGGGGTAGGKAPMGVEQLEQLVVRLEAATAA